MWLYLLWQELERAHAGRRRLRAALAEQRDSSDGQITELHRSMVKTPALARPWGRLLRLLRERLAALTGSALPGERPAHWALSHYLRCSS